MYQRIYQFITSNATFLVAVEYPEIHIYVNINILRYIIDFLSHNEKCPKKVQPWMNISLLYFSVLWSNEYIYIYALIGRYSSLADSDHGV
jgi:hypothetical protein